MDFVTAVALGLVQGITEFLPISTTGHLVMVREIVALNDAQILASATVFYLTASLALAVYFRFEIWILIQALIRKLGRLPTNEKDLTMVYALALATVPGIFFGFLFQNLLLDYGSLNLVAGVVFCSAIFFMYVEWKYYLHKAREVLTVKKGFLIGLFQVFSFIPGFSRTGASLAGGMLLGLTRLESTKFSFLLAIPITLAMGVKKLFELSSLNVSISWLPLLVLAAVNFVMVLVTVHYFLIFIRSYTLWPFIWYSLILSFLIGYFAFFA